MFARAPCDIRSLGRALVLALALAGCPHSGADDAGDAALDARSDLALDAHDEASSDAGRSVPYWGELPPPHSGTIALSRDEVRAFVVHPDSDSVGIVDVVARRFVAEVALGPELTLDAHGNWAPRVAPRALALAPSSGTLFVVGERSGEIIAIDTATLRVASRAFVCARAVGVVVGPDESRVYVACNADGEVAEVDASTLDVRARAQAAAPPWSLAFMVDAGVVRLAAGSLLSDAVTVFDLVPWLRMAERATLPGRPPRAEPRIANGVARTTYDLAQAPGGALWGAYQLVSVSTAQPVLNFETTLFPAIAEVTLAGAAPADPLTTDSRAAGIDGAFGDVVSGPRALAFIPGHARYALLVAQASEDVMVIDTHARVEVSLLRPLPRDWPQGIAISRDGSWAYLDERLAGDDPARSGDVVPIAIVYRADGSPRLAMDGPPIPSRAHDPMPAVLRIGQRIFHSANSSELTTTTNSWISCASCHPEGSALGATLRFLQGPRDVPANTGGLDGFLFRTANRTSVLDYRATIIVEQGGEWPADDAVRTPQLEALREYVLHALPDPPRPRTDPVRVARGRAIFERPDVGCVSCHAGPSYTDSGAGNPSLDLAGPVLLHDVGTCATGDHPDRPSTDVAGNVREPCRFDTPTLRAVYATPPYLHDGSAPTLMDVLTTRNTAQRHGRTAGLSPGELEDLVEYLRSL